MARAPPVVNPAPAQSSGKDEGRGHFKLQTGCLCVDSAESSASNEIAVLGSGVVIVPGSFVAVGPVGGGDISVDSMEPSY
jgi:hypothetical protein